MPFSPDIGREFVQFGRAVAAAQRAPGGTPATDSVQGVSSSFEDWGFCVCVSVQCLLAYIFRAPAFAGIAVSGT